MREHSVDGRELDTRCSDEVVANLQQAFRVNAHGILKEQIVVLGDSPVQRVLDREHSALRPTIEKRSEDVSRHRARQDFVVGGEFQSRHVAVGTALALDGDSAPR